MIRRLPFVLVFTALGASLQAWGLESEVTPIIRFGDPADAARVTLARANLVRVTGTRVNAGGTAAQIEFELADWPELVIRPTGEPADWTGKQALAIPFNNPTAVPIDLLVRVDDDPHADGEHHSLSGRARVRSNEAGVLILPLPTNDGLSMGMVAGPPREAPRLGGSGRMIGGARGAIDRRHVTAIHLILLRGSLGRTVVFGDPGVIRGADPGPEIYRQIVDSFGQYTRHVYGTEGNFARVGSGWAKVPDPFDPAFAAAVDSDVKEAASIYRDDPYLIGYFVDNELAWGFGNAVDPRLRYGVAVETLRLGAASPAKRAFVAQLSDKYRDTETFAAAWGLTLRSWDELRDANTTLSSTMLPKPAVIGDLRAFSALFAETYFRAVAEAIRRHDPQHLFLGSRFQARTPEAVAACAKHCDVVSFNVYREDLSGEEWTRLQALGKPVLIGEFQFGSTDTGLFWPGLFDVAAEEQRGPAYAAYLRSALANPAIVGCHWFQYVDEPLTGRLLDGENGHMGFVSSPISPLPVWCPRRAKPISLC
jgi:hypothetical protein